MTIKEVARIAGVSPAAVSRYFNGGSLGADKQNRIREVVEETGFQPNPLAKSMRTGKSGQIGVIATRFRSNSVTRILQGISDVIRKENYIMILGCTEHDAEQELRLIRAMQDKQVDGIVLMGRVLTKELKRAIESCSVPVVVTGQRFENAFCIYHDDFHAVEELTALALKNGRRHPAFLGVLEEDEQAGRLRREGFKSALRKAGFEQSGVPEIITGFEAEDGAEAMRQLLRDHPETDMVICAGDFAALGALRVIKESGRKVPEDIALAGCGDSWADSLTDPPLTSIHFRFDECGSKAAEMLLRLIRGKEEEKKLPEQIMLEYSITDRGSV